MDTLQPAIDGRITAGQEWLEFKLDGASWIEGGQMWVLEVEPVNSFSTGTNESEAPQSATTVEIKYPSAHSKQTPEMGLAIQENQHESDKIKSLAPGHLRAEKTFKGNRKACGPSLKRSARQRSRPEKLVRCDQCEKAFRYPSDLARHYGYRHKAAKRNQPQSETDSSTLSEFTPLALQGENTLTKSSKAFHQSSKAMSGRNARPRKHFCNECGKAFRYPSDLAKHQRVHARQKTTKAVQSESETDSSSSRELSSLAASVENTSINSSEVPSQNSKVTTMQNRSHRRQYFCKRCGQAFRYASDLARHHNRRHKAAKHNQSQSETDSPTLSESTLSALQSESTFIKYSKASHQKKYSIASHSHSEAMTDQNARPRKQLFCNECGKAFRYPSHIARHQRTHTKQKTAKAVQSASETDNSSPRELTSSAASVETTSINHSEAPSQNSKVTTKQNNGHRRRYFCKQCDKAFRYPSDLARHQPVHSRHRAAEQSRSQSEVELSESPLLALQRENAFTKASIALHRNSKAVSGQMENNSVNSSETLSQNSMLTPNRSPRHRKRRFCNECGESWSPHAHSGQKASKRAPSEAGNCGLSDLTSVMKLLENVSLSSSRALRQNSKGTTHRSSRWRRCFCGPCGDLSQHLSDLVRDPCANSERRAAQPGQSPFEAGSPSAAVLAENAFANGSQTLAKRAKTATEYSIPRRRENFCRKCGKAFQYPSHLARHQAVHSRQKGDLSPWEADSPTSLGPTAVEPRAASPRTNSSRAFRRSSKVTTDHCFWGSKLQFCTRCGKAFRDRSALARHKRVHSKRRADVPLPKGLRKENAAATVSEADSPNSMRAAATKPYLCDQCGEGFWWRSELNQHEYSHFDERPYYCSICGRQFRRHVQLVKHQRWHEGSQEGEGEGEAFQNVDADDSVGRYLPREVLQALPPETPGELCDMFNSPGGREAGAHDAGVKDAPRIHPANSIWEIGMSGQPYLLPLPRAGERGCCETDGERGGSTRPTEPSLQVEDVSSTISEPTASSSEIFTPMATVPAASPGACGLIASEPKEKTSTPNVSIDRLSQKSSPDSEWFPSPNRLRQLREQARSSAQGAGPHSCPICSKRFKCADYLTRHLNIHWPGEPHGCTLCEKTFGRRSYLLKHLKKRHHAVAPPLPSARVLKKKPSTARVTVCLPPLTSSPDPEWLPSQQRPRQPRKRDRSPAEGVEPPSCPICSKRFKCDEYLAKHLKVHRPGNLHSCILCEKKFGQRSYLLKHVRNVHGVGYTLEEGDSE